MLFSEVFTHFLLGSASISWDDGAFFRIEKDRGPVSAPVYVAVGSRESEAQLSTKARLKSVLEAKGTPVTLDVVPDAS